MLLNCLTCKAIVKAEEIGEYIKTITGDEYNYDCTSDGDLFTQYEKYTFLKCPQCSNPFVTCSEYSNEPLDLSNKLSTLYPTTNKIINSDVSPSIQNVFDEAIRCFEIGSFTACVIMCRKTIEGICNEYSIEKKNLKDKLIAMKEKGLIDVNLFDWADMLRLSGNDAAHDLDITFSSQDAQDIIDFTYAIIDYIFTYRKKFELFKERKNNQTKRKNNFVPTPPPPKP